MNEEINKKVCKELFASSAREVFEETNIPLYTLYNTRVLGFMRYWLNVELDD